MVRTRSTNSDQGSQAPVLPTKRNSKLKTGRAAKSKVAKKVKVNNTLSNVPNTAVDSDASTAPLLTLPSLSGFGSLAQHPSPLTGYEAQAAWLCELMNPPKLPKSYSGDKKEWPYFKAMFQNYVRTSLRSRNIDLMSTEGYEDDVEEKIYEWFLSLMKPATFDLIDPIYKNKGTKAFQFMDEQVRGTIEQRKFDCNKRIIELKYLWGECPDKYVAELTRLDQENRTIGLQIPLDLILGIQVMNLPDKLLNLQNRLQEKYRKGYPTRIGEYTLEFRQEINTLKMNGKFPNNPVNVAAAAAEEIPTSSNKQVKKRRKKNVQVANANTAPVAPPPQIPTYQPYEPQNNRGAYFGRGRGGRGNNQRGRGAPKRSDFQNYSERNTWHNNQKPTCLKCGSSKDNHIAKDCYSQVWCHKCHTNTHGPRACSWL